MERYDYLVVGAGLFGAAFAHEMKQHGKRCLVIDRRSHLAGNAYTELWKKSIPVHRYGAHIFHTSDRRIWDYVNHITPFHPYVHSPLANYRGEWYHLPFNMNTFHELWGVETEAEAREIIELQTLAPIVSPIESHTAPASPERFAAQTASDGALSGRTSSLERFALESVGRDLYEKLIRGYTEKQWGRPCSELPADILKRIPLRFTYDNNYFRDAYQGIPDAGYTALVEGMLEGIDVRLSCSYEAFQSHPECEYGTVLYTGAIDEFFHYELGELAYRSLEFAEEELPEQAWFQEAAVVNYTDAEMPFTRIIEHKHFAKECSVCGTIITREYPRPWSRGREAYYPVRDAKSCERYEAYLELAESYNKKEQHPVLFGGRLGLYRYLDMDRTIAEAWKLAEKFFPN